MIQCSPFRGSIATKWHIAAKCVRFTSTASFDTEEGKSSGGPTTLWPPKSTTKDGASKIQTASPRPSLPLSPLMDPKFLAARKRYSAPKAAPSKTGQTAFQQQLAKNPYARALATPVRMCSITREHMPKYFLEDFKLLAHPKNKVPFWLPESLLSMSVRAEESEADSEVQSEDGGDIPITKEAVSTGEGQVDAEELSLQAVKPPDVLPEKPEQSKTPAIGHSSYTLARRDLLHLIQDPAGWYGANPNIFLAPIRMRAQKDGRRVIYNSVWRSDMEDFVLDLMRKDVTQHLQDILRLKRGYIIGCSGWNDALAKKQVGAYLWTGSGNDDPPPEFASLDIGPSERKIPVLNFRRLLGRERLEQLKKHGIFGCEVLVLKHRRMTIELQLKLWKLQGYLAEYRDVFKSVN